MNATLIDRIETNSERAASVLFGGAVGYALYSALGASGLGHGAAYAAAAGVGAALLSSEALKRVGRAEPNFRVAAFVPPEYEAFGADELLLNETVQNELLLTDKLHDELLLTDADRVSPSSDVLELDQILAEIGPDSRVVRLFDRKAVPTPGELKSRIDDRLGEGSAAAAPSDAAQALSDALAELKRSLR